MKISIITVCYNAVSKIEKTILSVLNQTYANVEYIVVDGDSHDGTFDIIRKYENRISKLIHEPDNGLYDALNKGVRVSTGEWIGILNCGDYFCSNDTIDKMFMEPIPSNIGVIYGNCFEVDKKIRIHKKFCPPFEKSAFPPDYRHGASFVRKNIHMNYLYAVDELSKYGYALDYHQIYRMYKGHTSFFYKNVDVIEYEKEGISNNPWKNKYLRALIENDGKKTFYFYYRLFYFYLRALKNKIA